MPVFPRLKIVPCPFSATKNEPCPSFQGHLAIVVNYMKDGENRISFIKDVEATGKKADTIYSALSNEIEKCGEVECLSRFGSDGANVIKKLSQN